MAEFLLSLAAEKQLNINDEQFSALLDSQDSLAHLRKEFHIPIIETLPDVDANLVNVKDECVYMCGNSLGLCPKITSVMMNEELNKWAKRGVIGHFDDSARPWVAIGDFPLESMAKVVGAHPSEVAVMNSLTVNVHLMMVPFYTPTETRYKILIEDKAFPSDHYAVESQIRFHGRDPDDALVLLKPRAGENTLRTEDILEVIEKEGDSIALVMLSGVQYYTGQLFDIPTITKAAKAKGCSVGWDLAHAVGNAVLELHEWNVDFACWCSYKYLNSGPGSIAGIFVHSSHDVNTRNR
eukprot:Colp12_sorted_trinity150504_noHs@8438